MTTDFRSSNQSLFEITREFGSGSRPAPDPFDRFLEELGFYRKHTARDSSSLFRCVSEQVYDVQGHHERVRAECVQFMRENEELFQAAVKKMNFDYQCYLKNLSESRTRGSILELRAMGLLYQRNVMLFEPLSEGQWTATPNETWSRSIRVFFTKPGHFDSIFTRNYIQKAAYCQALVYEILYKNVFLLPDVDFAVEKMLHDRDEGMKFSEDKVVTFDGRIMTFDTPETTQCALSDYRFCHFHNRAGFEFEIEKYRQQKEKKNKHGHNLDLFLYDKDISCVRQLMKIGMTPFPYKVAKALDPSIYRNVEFDTWVLIRRERMYKDWYFGGNDFKVGGEFYSFMWTRKSKFLVHVWPVLIFIRLFI